MPYYFVLLGLLALIGVLLLWYQREATSTRESTLKLLEEIELEYEDFVQKRLTLAILQDDDWQNKRLEVIKEIEEALKPSLDALAALVSNTSHMHIKLPLDSPVFKNIAALTEAGFTERKVSANLEKQQQIFYGAFKDAVKADLSHRWLDHQTGQRLSP